MCEPGRTMGATVSSRELLHVTNGLQNPPVNTCDVFLLFFHVRNMHRMFHDVYTSGWYLAIANGMAGIAIE